MVKKYNLQDVALKTWTLMRLERRLTDRMVNPSQPPVVPVHLFNERFFKMMDQQTPVGRAIGI